MGVEGLKVIPICNTEVPKPQEQRKNPSRQRRGAVQLRCDQNRVRNRLYTDPFLMIPGWFERFGIQSVSLKTVRYTVGYGPGFGHSAT